MKFKEIIRIGTANILVNVGGQVPLVLTGTILAEVPRYHDDQPTVVFPKKIEVEGEITEEETFIVVNVTGAILPPGFPLTIANLTTEVAISLDYVIAVFPVVVV